MSISFSPQYLARLMTAIALCQLLFCGVAAAQTCSSCGGKKMKIRVWGTGNYVINGVSYPATGPNKESARDQYIHVSPLAGFITTRKESSSSSLMMAMSSNSSTSAGAVGASMECEKDCKDKKDKTGKSDKCKTEDPPCTVSSEGGGDYVCPDQAPEGYYYVCYSTDVTETAILCPSACVTLGGGGDCAPGQPDPNQDVERKIEQDEDESNNPGNTSEPEADSSSLHGAGGGPAPKDRLNQRVSLGRAGKFAVGDVLFSVDMSQNGFQPMPTLNDVQPRVGASRYDDYQVATLEYNGFPARVQYRSYVALIDCLPITDGITITSYDISNIPMVPATPILVVPGTGLKIFSTITAVKHQITLDGRTFHGIKVTTRIAGQAPTHYELYSSLDGTGGGESVEVRGSEVVRELVSPWAAVGGRMIRGETKTRYRRNTVNQSHYRIEQVTETYEKMINGDQEWEVLLSRTVGNGADQRTTSRFYYGAADPDLWARLEMEVRPDGSWEHRLYDNDGMLKAIRRPWKNSGFVSATATAEQIYQVVKGLPDNECFVEEYQKVLEGSGEGYYGLRERRFHKVRGVLTLREEQWEVSLIDPVTGLRVVEVRELRFAADGQLLSGAFVAHQASVENDTNAWSSLVYEIDANGVRSTYTESSTGIDSAYRQTDIITRTPVTHPSGIPHASTQEIIVSDYEHVLKRESQILTGSNFNTVGVLEFTHETVDEVSIERTFEDNVEIETRTRLADGALEIINEWGGQTVEFEDQQTGAVTRSQDGGDPVVSNGVVLHEGLNITTQSTYSNRLSVGGVTPEGYRRTTTLTAGGLSYSQSIEDVNGHGEIVRTFDAAGIARIFSRSRSAAGWTETEQGPGSFSKTTHYYIDGRIQSVTGTVIAEYHDYTVSAAGNLIETVFYGGLDSPRWLRRHTDGLGRLIKEERSAFGGGDHFQSVENHYNHLGQLIRVSRSGKIQGNAFLADQIMVYDPMGKLFRQGQDSNGNGQLDLTSQEPITEWFTEYVATAGQWWKVERTRLYERPEFNGFRESRRRTLLRDGPSSRVEEYGPTGAKHVTTLTLNRTQCQQVTTLQVPGSSQTGQTTVINGLTIFQSTPQSQMPTEYGYTPFGEIALISGEGGKLVRNYDAARRLQTETVTSGSESRTTTYAYYPVGHASEGMLQSKTAPYVTRFSNATSETQYGYDEQGRLVTQQGTGTYPVKYGYNAYGERISLTTYRNFTSFETVGDVTQWHFDPSSGLLLSKEDATGKKVTYSYYPGTALQQSRTWQRSVGGTPVKTIYTYDGLGQLTGKTYSDGTPSVSYSYRRDGALESLSDAAGVHAYEDWSADGKSQREIVTGDANASLAGLVLYAPVDGQGRRTGHQGVWTPAGKPAVVLPPVQWGYDSQGQWAIVNSQGKNVQMARAATGSTVTRTLTRADAANAGLAMSTQEVSSWAQGMHTINHSRSDYVQSRALGPVGSPVGGLLNVSIDAVDPDFGMGGQAPYSRWRYLYDSRGQVREDQKQYRVSGTTYSALPGLTRSRTFNDIGGAPQDNALNQTPNRSHTGKWISGMAPTGSFIEVNDAETLQQGNWYLRELPATSSPQWATVNIEVQGAPGTSHSGKVYVPPTTESYAYDDDGNLLSDARWDYQWDAENQLKSMSTRSSAVAAGLPERRLSYVYDGRGRRVRKVLEQRVSGQWELRQDVRFIYDGWNLIAEVEAHTGAADAPKTGGVVLSQAYLLRSYVWGPDVSGSLDGAGGVGGLLMVTRHERGTRAAESWWALMDLNGNVIGLASTAKAGRYAVYDYDGFGRAVRVNEPEEGLNPIRFSSKYTDSETGMSYYGFRYYVPDMEKWPSRDPIGERGGINLYGMVENDPVSLYDRLGLDPPGKGINACCGGKQYDEGLNCCIDGKPHSIKEKIKMKVCFRPADLPGAAVMDSYGKRHSWGKSDGVESGQGIKGGGVPGQAGGGSGYPGVPTTMNDHTGQSEAPESICVDVEVLRCCIRKKLGIGQEEGRWVPFCNDCNTVMADKIKECGGDWDKAYADYLAKNPAVNAMSRGMADMGKSFFP